MAGEIVVLVTCPSAESENLAIALVEERLAACVNIIDGVRSIYSWEGKICNETERLLVIKTHSSVWETLRDRVQQLHSYDVPEVVCLPIADGLEPYMKWIGASVGVGL